ncbi:MAG TPA: flagellar motor protein MotB [Elusimicrobiota bacterium]|nr:flagellar motor protein MotB [Elusimicrobiota bacterium]
MSLKAPKGFIEESDPRVSQLGHAAPPWLINYADLMTELVCFFIILYALSAALNKNIVGAAQKIKQMMKQGQMHGAVSIDKNGLKITLDEQGQVAFFESGSADTTAQMQALLAKLAPTLKSLAATHDIVVEGYTDNQPIHNEYYDSNWELSTARATSVARMLIDKYGFPPQHMAAEGYGQYRPIVPNDTPEHKAMNRRVVFLVKSGNAASLPAATPAVPAGAQPPQPASP